MTIINTKLDTAPEIAKTLWEEGILDDVKAVEEEVSTVKVIKDAQGRKGQWTEETKDLNNKPLSKRVNVYAYYDTGEIDTITQSRYDGGNTLLSRQEIKHYKDGRPAVLRNLLQANQE